MKQTWKNKWLMLLGGVILLGGLSGCEDRTEEAVVPPADSEEVTVSMVFGFAEDSSDNDPQRLAVESSKAAFDVTQAVNAVTRSVMDVPDKLYNLEILQYDASGTYKTGKNYGDITLGTHLDVTLNVMNDCQLLVVARGNGGAVGSLINKNLDNVKSMDVKSSVINKIDLSTANAINAMPYVLHLEHVNVVTGTDGKAVIQSPEGSYDTRLLLKRLAARLTVSWNYNVSGYELK